MAKRLTAADIEKIDHIIRENVHQNGLLAEILICLKGNELMNVEGVIPAQKRMDRTLKEIQDWENEMRLYIGIVTSRKLWRGLFIFLAFIASIVVGIKYGWHVVLRFIKNIFV